MNQQHPIQEQIKKLLDDHGVQILGVYHVGVKGIALEVQDVVSSQKTTAIIPFGKEV